MPALQRSTHTATATADLDRLGAALAAMTPDQLATYLERLDARSLAIAQQAQERALANQRAVGWRTNPATMAVHLEGDGYKDFRFSRYLAERFRDAVTGVAPFQIWNLPAQLGKTSIVKRGVAWALDRDPTVPIIIACYGADLAEASARWVRDYGIEHADQLRYRLRSDATKVSEWLTTEGGGLKAAGIHGAISGFPAGGIIIDDPHKNWQEAHSEAEQQAVWDLYRAVLRVRLRMGGWMIVIHTRYCEGDLTDRILQDSRTTGEEWLHVRLPMIAEEPDPANGIGPDPLGRQPGEVLEPEQYDEAAATVRYRALGSYLGDAMEQQRPGKREGGIIKRAWWVVQDEVPERCDEWLTSWDLKLKDVAKRGDFVVGQVWGRVGGDFYMYEQLRGQWSQATVKAAIALAQVRYPHVRRHIIENTGNGPEVMADLRRGHPGWTCDDALAGELGVTLDERPLLEAVMRHGMSGLVPNTPKGDKRVRVIAVSGIIEARNAHLRNSPGALVLVDEAANFPTGKTDDCVDAMSQALAVLSGTTGTTSVVTAADATVGRSRPGSQVPARISLARGAALRR